MLQPAVRPEPQSPSTDRQARSSGLDYAIHSEGVTWGNEVTLYSGGNTAFPAMLEAIAGARRSVFLESYIFKGDETGRIFLDVLAAAASRGVMVRLIYDAVGSLGLPASALAHFEKAGGKVLLYRPVSPWRRHWGILHRDHRKLLAVDEHVGFTGGLNIGNEYDDRIDDGLSWRDLHVRVVGPAAERLARLFARNWNKESEPALRLQLPRNVALPTATRIDADDAPASDALAGNAPVSAPAVPTGAVAIVGNSEWRHRSLIRRSFLYATRRARRSIYIANSYFIPDWTVSRALRSAARRGVDVRVVVPARSDVLLCDLAARATFGKLLRDGVRIAEWQNGMMHAKAASIDGAWATVGSYNFDRRSLRYNLEVTANFFDRAVAGDLDELLRADFDASIELERRAFSSRPLIQRLLELIAYQTRMML